MLSFCSRMRLSSSSESLLHSIRPIPGFFDGRHYCTLDWHLITIAFFGIPEDVGLSTSREFKAFLMATTVTFELDGIEIPAEETTAVKTANFELFGSFAGERSGGPGGTSRSGRPARGVAEPDRLGDGSLGNVRSRHDHLPHRPPGLRSVPVAAHQARKTSGARPSRSHKRPASSRIARRCG